MSTTTPAIDHVAAPEARGNPPRTALQIVTVLVVGLAAVTFLTVSVPGTYFLILMFLPLLWAVLGLVWVVLALVTIARSGFLATATNRYLLAMALIAAGTAGAVASGAPFHVRLALSRPAMEALAVELLEPGVIGSADRWIGLFDAESITEFAGGYRFLVKGTGFLDPAGFAYSPNGEPPNLGGEDRYTHIEGPWWVWVESW